MTISQQPIRTTVQARFADGTAYEGPIGTTLEAFIKTANPPTNSQIVGAFVDGRLRELSHKLMRDADIAPVTIAQSDGARIYRRSLCFLLITAVHQAFEHRRLVIQHSMPFGGYYCECDSGVPFTEAEISKIRETMQRLIKEDHPISQIQVPLDEALQLFDEMGDHEKQKLFRKRRKDYLTVYDLQGVRDYFHGFMVPSTGYMTLFELHRYNDGFIIQFPRRHAPSILQPFEDEPRLARVFRTYNDWLERMGVPSVTALNESLVNGRIQEVILTAEAQHQRQLATIAAEIANKRDPIRLILISGPTSAGKTTFSKRLAIQLLAQGLKPMTLGMDNYFVNREDTPRDIDGKYNFEAFEAVDVPLFQQHLAQLLNGQTIIRPLYNFYTGQREWGDEFRIDRDRVIIIEGIHGLNPALVANIPSEQVYRIFISAFTQLNLDKHNRVPTTDTRLLRRIVRDAQHRGYSAADTIGRWQSVRRGEKNYIFPHQHHANVFFNSALVYELAVLKQLAFPLLLQVEPGTPQRVEANRLLAFLQWFDPIPPEKKQIIASDSILREFIGGSIMDEYEPGVFS